MDKLEQEMRLKIDSLRKNRENIPLDVLKDRYHTGYYTLIEQIKIGTSEIINKICFQGVIVHESKAEKVRNIINQEMETQEVNHRINQAIFHDFDLDKAIEIANGFRYDVEQIAEKEGVPDAVREVQNNG